MTRILIIQGHPDPSPERLCRTLAGAYGEGALAAGHEVETIDLAALDIQLLRTQSEFEQGGVPDGLKAAAEAIREAEHIVLVFPIWLGTMPALVKAFLEQVLRPGVAFAYRDKGLPEKLLKGRSARVVVTMGMPAIAYRLWFRAHGVKALERNILKFVGISPVRTTMIGGIGAIGEAKRRSWLEEMRRLGQAAR